MLKGTCQTEVTSNSENNKAHSLSLAIIELRLSEGIRQVVS